MSYFQPFNPNPAGNRVGDCTVRAISKATGKTWDEIYAALAAYGFAGKDMPSANRVWGRYLKDQGFCRHLIEDESGEYTVEDFCREHPQGVYLLAIDGHVVCSVDGLYYDSWDSGGETPVYYWTKG